MDLKQLLEPKTRFIFFKNKDLAYAFPIVQVKESILYFSSEQLLPENLNEGHFLAADNAGIVLFSNPEIKSLQTDLDVELHMIDFKDIDYSITNRRMSYRYEFKEFLPISFSMYGDIISAQLINISEGGLRIRINTPLKKDIICRFQIKLPLNQEQLHFETDGVVVYTEHEAKHNNYMVGISFVTPELKNDEDLQTYLNAKTRLKEFINEKEKIL